MVTCAGVTEADFDKVFASVEECYSAAYEQGLARLSRSIATGAGAQQGWLERVRSGLVALLGFCDDYSSWARLLVLEAPFASDVTFACRRQLHEVLARLLDNDESVRIPAGPSLLTPALTGELIVGGVFSVIRTSMLEDDVRKLVELAPSLMAFIVAPYLGHAAAQAELEGRPSGVGEASASESKLARAQAISRTAGLPIRATHRTTLVLRAIAQTPYSNNREIAQAAGLSDEGQTSKLLARLERQDVIENVGIGAARGEPNAWLLTPEGRRVLELLGESFADRAPRRATPR